MGRPLPDALPDALPGIIVPAADESPTIAERGIAAMPGRFEYVIAVVVLFTVSIAAVATDGVRQIIADFAGGLDDWAPTDLSGQTRYRIVELEGEPVLEAHAEAGASTLYRELDIDPVRTPYLHWRWRVQQTFGTDIDERDTGGDDYAARLSLVRSGGWRPWRTRVLTYVWSSAQPVDEPWPNPYAPDHVKMWAVNSGDDQAGIWVSHVRDLRADWRAAFGEDIGALHGVALMTDANETGGSVRAWYGGIFVSSATGRGADHPEVSSTRAILRK